jgi:serine protease Do
MSMRSAPGWTGAVIGMLLGLLVGVTVLFVRERLAHADVEAGGGRTAAATGAETHAADRTGAPVVSTVDPDDEGSSPADVDVSRRNALVLATEHVAPAVVSINVIQHRTYRYRNLDVWERFFPGMIPRREFRQDVQGMGSGFIVSHDGYVLTNDHVVEGADEIIVTLSDGRQFQASVLEEVQRYDLALLQLDCGDAELPVASLGHSDDLYIGEWAIAIGSPFGYLLADTQPTVTVGVISALNRDIKREDQGQRYYLGMIQTDAAINPGNSGGPLVNARGDVIGINTFIFTESGGSIGIGFAVPIERAHWLIDEVTQYGRYRSAYSGLAFQQLTPNLVRAFGLEDPVGFIVLEVEQGSPAWKAGLRVRDIIRSINGVVLKDRDTVTRLVYEAKVGTELEFVAERDGEQFVGVIRLEEMPR